MLAGPGLLRGVGRPSPSSQMPLTAVGVVGDLPAGSSFSRASVATRLGPRGYIEAVSTGVIRQEYDPSAVFNAAQNPWMDGAVQGSPGTLPAPLTVLGISGLTWNVAGVGVEGGEPYVDLRVSGTAGATNTATIRPFALQTVQGRSGEVWTGAVKCRQIGAVGGVDWWRMNMLEVNSAGTVVAQDGASSPQIFLPTTDTVLTRTRTLNNAATWTVALSLEVRVTTGSVIDATVRLKGYCINPGATSLFVTAGVATVLQRVNGVPQFRAEGILLEDVTTNLALYSEDMLNAGGWVAASGWTGTAGQSSPRNDLAGMLFDEGSAASTHILSTTAAISVTAFRHIASFFVKSINSPFWQVGLSDPEFGATAYANFDLSAGTVTFQGALATVARIIPLPFGWYRLVVGATAVGAAATASFYACPMPDAVTTTKQPSFTGTNRQALLFGAQFELRTDVTSYMVTGAATAARVKDIVRVGGVDGLLDGATDSIALGMTFLWSAAGNGFMLEAGAAVASDGFTMQINAAGSPGVRAFDNGVQVAGAFTQALSYRQRGAVAFAVGGGSCWNSWQGAPVSVDASCPSTDPVSGTQISLASPNASAIIGACWIARTLQVWRGVKLSQLQTQQAAARLM